MSLILSIANGSHDASASLHEDYRTLAAVQQERMSRKKGHGKCVPWAAVDEVLSIAEKARSDVDVICLMRGHFPARYCKTYSPFRTFRKRLYGKLSAIMGKEQNISLQQELRRANTADANPLFDGGRFLKDFGFRADTQVFFFNHHLAHALPPLFHNPDWQDALIYTADGGGDWVTQSHRYFRDNKLELIYGGDEEIGTQNTLDSVALVYGAATVALGWKINRHEGKLTGLAASGSPVLFEELRKAFKVDKNGRISSTFTTYKEMASIIEHLAKKTSRENVASSVQALAESVTVESIGNLLKKYPSENLGLSGGLFANVLLNQKLLDQLPIKNIFIYPAMSDAGLCTGGALAWLLERDGVQQWLSQRALLDNVYLGKDYTDDIDSAMKVSAGTELISDDPVNAAVERIMQNKVVSIYTGRQEFGPRALGARSVTASPEDPSINQSLNQRMERSEFMPFAPYVRIDDAHDVFELPAGAEYPARFMTITCKVKAQWSKRISAVVHIDNTARPQIIDRETNPLYYDILTEYKNRSGLPVLINTSFNVHEEPIINTPAECIKALRDNRVDYVVTTKGLYK